MCDHLLSLLHIQKLGHPIEEIRLRALSSVISKYNLKLVDETNLENTKLLLDKLLNWFSYENYSEEEKILSLMLKILSYENADLILKEIGFNEISKKLNEVDLKVGLAYPLMVQDIKQLVAKAASQHKENCHAPVSLVSSVPKNPELSNGYCHSDREASEYLTTSSSRFKYSEYSETSEKPNTGTDVKSLKHETDSIDSKSIFRIEYFPWQHLIPGDKHVLSSVYDGLRYIDNKNSILQSCQFFNEVVSRDYPVEIFIQRPLILRTFLQLIENTERDIRVPVRKCLTKMIQNIKEKIQLTLNPSMFNSKKEFYSTSIFPNDKENSCEHSGTPDCIELRSPLLEDELFDDSNDGNDIQVMKYQLSLPQFCFEVLEKVLPHLKKKCNLEEMNSIIALTYETFTCLISIKKTKTWPEETKFQNKFFNILGILQDLLKIHKNENQIIYVCLLYIVVKLLNSFRPPLEAGPSGILPRGLHVELGSCATDYILVLMFPHLHSEILRYMQEFKNHNEVLQDYEDFLSILESMKSCVQFLRPCGRFKTKMEKLQCVFNSLASLDFHQNVGLVQGFVGSCLLKWRKSQMKEPELKIREKILVKLLAHGNVFIKINTYKEIYECAVKLLGVDEAANANYEFPGDKMDFLFHVEVLTEIICHGLSSSVLEVRKYSSEIIIHLLKSKFIMSEGCWSEFVTALIPCLSLLQCFADKASTLGRCIVKMFDPDVARSSGLPPIEVLKGNIRFLFSKNNLTRDEAISRLFWLLSKDDHDNKKLPRMSVLTNLNLSGICSCVQPQEYTKIRQSFYSPGKLCDVMEMLNADSIEPNLRRSALSQMSVMMDDVHLHATFLDQNGLENILGILENCLIEKEYLNYPDSVIPIVDVLKVLSLHNVSVRQELGSRTDVLFNILRSLFLFSSDSSLRQNAVELLCLLLYSDCIIRVPPDLSIKCTISFPEIVVNRMCLPFSTHVHWRNSRHLEPSMKKGLMGKENCSKLIRVSWAIQWVGSLSEVLSMKESDLGEKAFSPGIPDDMRISYEDIQGLRNCAFGVSVKQTLYNIQNATTHEAVFGSLYKLHSYFLLYRIDKTMGEKSSKEISSDTSLSHMLWESTLERFMTSKPSCNEDEILLLEVLRFVQLLLKSFKSERLIDWVGKLLSDEHQPLPKMLKAIGKENFGLVGKELRLAIIELTQEIVSGKKLFEFNKWFLYMELVSDHLILDDKERFYNVAFVDWLLGLLVVLTGERSWNFARKAEYIENLILRVMEIIIAFHCTKDSVISFMGSNIVKNSLFVLNHILEDSQVSVKGWERVWFRALTNVVGQKKETNYCWLLSLWFMRDPVTRAAAFQLFVGFTSTPHALDLLVHQLNIPFHHIWTQGFKVLFDENECSFVREKTASILFNLVNQGAQIPCGDFFGHLDKINFYPHLVKAFSNFQCEPVLLDVALDPTLNVFEGPSVTSPSFVQSLCALIQGIITLSPSQVSDKVFESGVLDSVTKVIGEIPESAYVCAIKHENSFEVVRMYASVCRLMSKCATSNWSAYSFLVNSQDCINFLFSMIDHNFFCDKSKAAVAFRNELWIEILNLFSVLLVDNPESTKNNKNSGFVLLNNAMTDNGIDHFVSSLYVALTSDLSELRTAVFNFLINLFRHEMTVPKHMGVSDMFERKVSSAAVKSCMSAGWKGLDISESLTLNFGIRAADILHQIFLLNTASSTHSSKAVVADCLGSLLAVCKPAQDFCISKNLANTIVTIVKQIVIKLNLECVDNLKKLSSRKRIDPQLADLETLFRLATNLMASNEKAKAAVADCALSSVVHKLWPWIVTTQSLHIVTLKMLCTLTHFCDQGCRTLVLSTSLAVLGLKKSPGPANVINSITNQVTQEMDLISKTRDSQILCLSLQLLSNCCRATECRSLISKSNFLQSAEKLHPSRKKRFYGETVVESWLKFFIVFSTHQEGQLALSKSQDILDLLVALSTSQKFKYRINALTALRNICFHQLNRVRMLSCCSFVSLMFQTLDSKRREEIQAVVVTLWVLSCNAQKSKVTLRSSGFESKLVTAKRYSVLNEDTETAELIDVVLDILKNK